MHTSLTQLKTDISFGVPRQDGNNIPASFGPGNRERGLRNRRYTDRMARYRNHRAAENMILLIVDAVTHSMNGSRRVDGVMATRVRLHAQGILGRVGKKKVTQEKGTKRTKNERQRQEEDRLYIK
jgi:hypothetical protein